MKMLKTALVAGALAAATLTGIGGASAAERLGVFVGRDSFGIGFTSGHVHRGHVPSFYGNWYAAPAAYRPHAFYRSHPRLRACFLVNKHGFAGNRPAVIQATMCYARNGTRYVVPGSRHIVRFI